MLRNNLGQSPTGENGVQASADSSHEQLNTQPPSVSTEPETRSSPISDIQILEQVVVSRELFMTLLDEYAVFLTPSVPPVSHRVCSLLSGTTNITTPDFHFCPRKIGLCKSPLHAACCFGQ